MNRNLKIIPTGTDDVWFTGHYLNEKKTVKFKVENKYKKIINQNIGKVVDVPSDVVTRMQFTGDSDIKAKIIEVPSLDEWEEQEAPK
jgi:predicted Ser/Thr protein kinase